jgi:carbamoyltransferase
VLRLGVKLTHDAGIALFDDTRLLFSHEAEKTQNNPRHSSIDVLDLEQTLLSYGVRLADIDRIVVDGWLAGRVHLRNGEQVQVAEYYESARYPNPVVGRNFDCLTIAPRRPYVSCTHAASHALSAYATSPWSKAAEPALILTWDGAMLPRLYHFDPTRGALTPRQPLFGFVGAVYPVFASFFGPFVHADGPPQNDVLPERVLLDIPGKVMAYAGLGSVNEELFAVFDAVYTKRFELSWRFVFNFARTVAQQLNGSSVPDEDILASFQAYIGRRLVQGLSSTLERDLGLPRRLCFAGGCALNIEWNAMLRSSGLFEDVWVPPFPNDAGSALGCAVSDLVASGENGSIDWDVYRGQELEPSQPPVGWTAEPCDVRQLAALLYSTGDPVVFLHDRSELGPRALGNRSILCPATSPFTRDRLNKIKQREWYRPIAPVCLESEASRVFDPGSIDPYMLFRHRVRTEWRDRVPAIVHLDNTARLQTIRCNQNPTLFRLLSEYYRLSGIPLLCNTSANFKGAGFFLDVRSAADWGRIGRIWSDGVLYSCTSSDQAA